VTAPQHRACANAGSADPEIPEGTEMVDDRARGAARRHGRGDAPRRDVFVMGEEVAEYQGAYKITQGLLDEFGAKRVIDTPITEHGFTGIGVGAALAVCAHRRVHDLQLRHAGDRPDHQLRRQDALHVRRPDGRAHRLPRPNGAAARVGAQHSQDYAAWYSHIPGLKVVMPYSAADAKGLLKAAIRDPEPGDLPRKRDPLRPDLRGAGAGRFRAALRQGAVWREGTDVTLVSFGIGMTYALEAAEELAKDGIEAEVIDLRTCARWT
jgi:pyruvate dehydrogenase E1 component beta subunit